MGQICKSFANEGSRIEIGDVNSPATSGSGKLGKRLDGAFWKAMLAWLLLLFPASAAESKRLQILTSFPPAYCWTANVAGDLADVENLLPGTVGPHDYEFSPRDLRRLHAADVLVVNGLELEPWLARLKQSLADRAKPVIVELSAGLKGELIYDLGPQEEGKAASPRAPEALQPANAHIWLDPRLAARAITNIATALRVADPAHADGYAANEAAYIARLQLLDAEIAQGLAPVPQHDIVTFHNAFPYFARRYGLRVIGVVEEVPDVSPSARHLSNLGRIIHDRGVKVIFAEPQFSRRLADQVSRDLKVGVAELDTLETGALTPQFYEETMRRNLKTLQTHLR